MVTPSFDSIDSMLNLFQILNLQDNKLKALPSAIGSLPSLQSLNLQGIVFCFDVITS